MNSAIAQVNRAPYVGHQKPLEPHNNSFLRKNHSTELSQNKGISLDNFFSIYKGKTLSYLLTEAGTNGPGGIGGPKIRYVTDPLYPSVVIDMKHLLSSVIYPSSFGDLNEERQANSNNGAGTPSAHNPQDYYSNNLGNDFSSYYFSEIIEWYEYIYYGSDYIKFDTNFLKYLTDFLKSLKLRKDQ